MSKSKIATNFNNFNKRALSSHYRINKKEINNITNDKSNMKIMIKDEINSIFKDLPKEYEDNPVILYKFNSLIKNMKNIQLIIQNKTNSFCSKNNKYEAKNNKKNEIEKHKNDDI